VCSALNGIYLSPKAPKKISPNAIVGGRFTHNKLVVQFQVSTWLKVGWVEHREPQQSLM
jgi:hypothetical protein